jgi:hypothetical protein
VAQDMKGEFNEDMENLREKKESNRNPENKKSLKSNKKYLKTTPADWNKWETEFQSLKTK